MASDLAGPILVTGAGGFIGRDLVDHLLERRYHVRALVRPRGARALPPAAGLAVVEADIRDPDALGAALAGVRAVCHLAALKSDEAASAAVNVGGAANLVAACRASGVRRVVNVSTQSVKLARRGTYGETKLEAERVLHGSGLDVTTLRPSVVYGADRTGVFARMRDFMTRLPVLPVIGDGRWRSRPIHVRDVSRAVVACLETGATVGQVLDLGGPDEVTMDEFLDAIGRTLGIRRPKLHVPAALGLAAARTLARVLPRPPVTVSNVLGSTQDTACDPAPANAALGLRPLGLGEGLEQMLDDEVRARPGGGPGPVLRVAVVGLGKMGLFHATLLHRVPNVRLVGLVDTDARLAGPARSMGLAAPFFASVEALAAARPVQAVLVCTPTFAHYAVVEACLRRGLHVLVEKPLADSAERAAALAALAASQGAVHAVGYHLAYSPVFERARALLREGLLGPVEAFRARLEHAEVLGPKRGWMFDPAKAGGGLVRNTASHLIFLLEWFFGTPSRVRASLTRIHSTAIEDAVTATLAYATGLTGSVEASWSVPGKAIMEVEIEARGARGTLCVTGADIRLDLRAPAPGFAAGTHRIHLSDLPAEGVFDLAPDAGGAAYYRQDRGFVDACRGGGRPRTAFEAAARAERVIDAIYRAAAAGAEVAVG
jgi:predicted dehydrogenase/nucleoside-diphosphate-sugar epimerase